jgi:hypothetical protein
VASGQLGPNIFSAIAATHINAADFVNFATANPGQIQSAPAATATGLIGIAQHDSNAVYNQVMTGLQAVFGVSQISPTGGLLPTLPGEVLVVTLGANIIVAINLSATTGWMTGGTQQANLGTQVGLNIDPVTGFYFADPTVAAVGTITQKVVGPGQGGPGDLAARVYVSFNPSALAIPTGH